MALTVVKYRKAATGETSASAAPTPAILIKSKLQSQQQQQIAKVSLLVSNQKMQNRMGIYMCVSAYVHIVFNVKFVTYQKFACFLFRHVSKKRFLILHIRVKSCYF